MVFPRVFAHCVHGLVALIRSDSGAASCLPPAPPSLPTPVRCIPAPVCSVYTVQADDQIAQGAIGLNAIQRRVRTGAMGGDPGWLP